MVTFLHFFKILFLKNGKLRLESAREEFEQNTVGEDKISKNFWKIQIKMVYQWFINGFSKGHELTSLKQDKEWIQVNISSWLKSLHLNFRI